MSNSDSTHHSAETEISTVDLLGQRLDNLKTKGLTREQLYQASYKTFHKIKGLIRPDVVLDHTNNQDMIEAIAEYSDELHDCSELLHLAPIWELAELLYFPLDSHNTAADLAVALSSWLDQYYPIQETDDWTWALRHLRRGNTSVALRWILKESRLPEQEDAMIALFELIEQYGLLSTNTTDYTYRKAWQAWKETCQISYEQLSVDEETDSSLYWCRRALQILMGEETEEDDVLLMEQVIAVLLYTQPLASPDRFRYAAQQIENHTDETDDLLIIADNLLKGLLDDALGCSDDIWLQTHLGQVLIATGAYTVHHLPSSTEEAIMDPVFYSIQQYAHLIAENYGMWTEAVIYLTFCQENQAVWIQQLLGKDEEHLSIPWDSVDDVLSLAIEHNLRSVEQFIYRATGKREEKQDHLKEATIAYDKAQDLASLDRLAEKAFERYRETGQLDSVVMDIESLHQSQPYSFLIRYQQLKDTMAQEAWQEAAHQLWALLKDEHIPPAFSIVLLIDNRLILKDAKNHYYSLDQLTEWIELFNQLDTTSSFIQHYYNMTQQTQLTTDIILAKLREQLAFKAATAPY